MELKLYFVLFAVHKAKEWCASAGYIFAKDTASALKNLADRYGEVKLRSIEEVSVEEGTILYGERWHTI